MLCLRRVLSGFRFGVGGPALLSVLHGRHETIKHLIRGIDRGFMNVPGYHVADLQSQQPRNAYTVILPNRDRVGLHLAILQGRSSKRNRPFIPVLAGGNA